MPESITCPVCSRTSYHPEDVRQGYCGHCHWWTSDPMLGAPWVMMERIAFDRRVGFSMGDAG